MRGKMQLFLKNIALREKRNRKYAAVQGENMDPMTEPEEEIIQKNQEPTKERKIQLYMKKIK